MITIARQHGSGGRRIGEKLALQLGYEFYDNNLITMSAKKLGIEEKHLMKADESVPNSILYTLALGSTAIGGISTPIVEPINDKLFNMQSEIIRDLSSRESAIFVGRCADYVLDKNPNVIKIFIYADFECRIRNIMDSDGISETEAKNKVVKVDKNRANYYNFYTGRKWGKLDNYDLFISSSAFSDDEIVSVIKDIIDKRNISR